MDSHTNKNEKQKPKDLKSYRINTTDVNYLCVADYLQIRKAFIIPQLLLLCSDTNKILKYV